MITKDALEHLQHLALAASNADTTTDNGFMLIPAGSSVASLEQFNAGPAHFKESFSTDHIPSFMEYRQRNGLSAACYIDKKEMAAKIIFDAGDTELPGHRYHQAKLVLTKSPLMVGVLGITGSRLKQRGIAEWLEDWRFSVTAESSAGDEIEIKKVITAIRNFSVRAKAGTDHKEESLAASKSAFAEIEAGNKDYLPEFIIAHGEPYLGLPEINIPLRLSVRLSTDRDDAPMFGLSMVRQDVLINEIAESFAKTLETAFGEDHPVLIGTV